MVDPVQQTTREAFRQIGRNAASNGVPVLLIDDADDWTAQERDWWREGWREQRRTSAGLKVVA